MHRVNVSVQVAAVSLPVENSDVIGMVLIFNDQHFFDEFFSVVGEYFTAPGAGRGSITLILGRGDAGADMSILVESPSRSAVVNVAGVDSEFIQHMNTALSRQKHYFVLGCIGGLDRLDMRAVEEHYFYKSDAYIDGESRLCPVDGEWPAPDPVREILRGFQGMIDVVDWMLIGRCNLECPFCYGPDPTAGNELDWPAVEKLARFVTSRGVQGVVIAGGEPTLSPHVVSLSSLLKSLGLWVAIQTNGTRLSVLRQLASLVDVMAFPIDSVTSAVDKLMRTDIRTPKVLEAIDEVRRIRPDLPIKIGTVITHYNVNELPLIGSVVDLIGPSVWKMYELRPRGAGRQAAKLRVEAGAAWEKATEFCVAFHSDYPVVLSSTADSIRAYLIVNPDSRLLVPELDHYMEFGKLIQDGRLYPDRWYAAVNTIDRTRHTSNVTVSFPSLTTLSSELTSRANIVPSLGNPWSDR